VAPHVPDSPATKQPTPSPTDRVVHRVTIKNLAPLRAAASGGDARAQAALRRLLDENPDFTRRVGDLAKHAEQNLIRLAAGEDHLLGEAMKRVAEDLRQSLVVPGASPLEQLAAERVAAAWLHLHYVESQVARADGPADGVHLWLKRQGQADRSLQAAFKSLLMIQAIHRPNAPPLVSVGSPAAQAVITNAAPPAELATPSDTGAERSSPPGSAVFDPSRASAIDAEAKDHHASAADQPALLPPRLADRLNLEPITVAVSDNAPAQRKNGHNGVNGHGFPRLRPDAAVIYPPAPTS